MCFLTAALHMVPKQFAAFSPSAPQIHFSINVSFIGLQACTHLFFCAIIHSYQGDKSITRSKSLFQSAHHRTHKPILHTLLGAAFLFFSIWSSTLSGLQCTPMNSAVLMSWKCFENHHLSPKVTRQNTEECIFCFSSSGGKHNL